MASRLILIHVQLTKDIIDIFELLINSQRHSIIHEVVQGKKQHDDEKKARKS